jgi:hypothetical protein
MRRVAAAAVAVIVAAIALAGTASAASAAAQPSIALVAHTVVVAPNAPLSVTVSVAGVVPTDAELVVEAYRSLASPRSELRHVLDGSLQKAGVGFVATALDNLAPDASGRYTITLPTVTTTSDHVAGTALFADAAMYPIVVKLRSHNTTLSELTSFVVRATDPAAPPLSVAFVLPISGGPTLQPDGTTLISPDDRSRLQQVASVLTKARQHLTVVPTPELLEGLGRSSLPADAQILSAFAGAVGNRQVLATPYVTMDPASAAASGLAQEFTKQLTLGEDTLATQLSGIATDRTTWLAASALTDGAVGMLRDLGVRHLVVPATALQPPADQNLDATLASTVQVSTADPSQSLDVAVVDPTLATAFNPQPDPVLAAYHFVADLDSIALQAGTSAGHGVVVAPPVTWQPDPTFLTTVLSLVQSNALLRPVTLDEFFRTVGRDSSNPTRTLAPAAPADEGAFAQSLALTRISLGAFSSMLPSTDPLPTEAEAVLRVSLASSLTAAQRNTYLDEVNTQLGGLRNSVDAVTTRHITLTGKSSEIPLTLRRRTKEPIRVRVHLASPKLEFPENDFVVTLDADVVQQRVPVSARASGTFPLTVQILTPSGDVAVAPATEMTVQATALSGLGIVLTGGAVLVLVTWWVRQVRRSRRRRHRADHPSAGVPPAPGTPPPATLPAP